MRRERRDREGQLLSLETEPTTIADVEEAAAAGLELVRCIEQLRVALPLATSMPETPLPTTTFDPTSDVEAFLAVNNRAFAWHPDQSNWTEDHLHERMGEPWFEPEGFLLHHREGRLAGFCWTKIHPADGEEPRLGEIFVIAVDPEFHGRGLGRALTIAGLSSLAERGVEHGMLHVEFDNVAARTLYENLGFELHDTHCWWELPEEEAP